ncbi:MAG: isoleucine--tRNA ligase [Ruminococcaceae bacterium]|nr:isoleucine--tRNA ligase [Oscillospiraceae bacterium]
MSQDYNSTINLPKTEFPMRAGLPKREPDMLAAWENDNLYEKIVEKNEGRPQFILHDGPPFSNGSIHMGTAMNKCLKDFIVRYKNMAGFSAPYTPGWDNHGMPIESAIIKQNKLDRKHMSIPEFRNACTKFAENFVDVQRNQFKRLGVIGDWEKPYLTMDPKFEAEEVKIFGEMYKKGYIYKGLKPVYWCPVCETALAEAEIEYKDDPCTTVYVKFKVNDDLGKLSGIDLDKTYFVIWTTTIWTLPGNLAIALNPSEEYVIAKAPNGENYIMAEALANKVMKVGGFDSFEVIDHHPGQFFENMLADHPFLPKTSRLLLADYVTMESGTGCVHTAPGFGADDYQTCRRYGMEMVVPVDDTGRHTDYAGKYAGMKTEESNPVILADMKESGALFASEDIVHSYPHCWRCKGPIIFRATDQWFCSVDAFKDEAVAACNDVQWFPEWGYDRIVSMVRERADWCISRQRHWGLPIPVFYCEDCEKPICDDATIEKISKIFGEKGSNAWFEMEVSDLLPEGYTCPHCGGTHFFKETDTLDGWFDSGSTHIASMELDSPKCWPADLYLEGADQYRGWFQSSLLTAVALRGKAPYRQVLTHGWTVDGEGKAMHKSLGNGVAPEEIIEKYGADVLRLWAASADYRQDMRCSDAIFKQLSDTYLKIRNTSRYILGNLNGFDPNKCVAYDDLCEMDKWALSRLNTLVKRCIEAYDKYEFYTVVHAVHNFCVVDMSNFYLDVIKDRLYCDGVDSASRRGAQTVIYRILDSLVRILSPILAFTSDEIWKAMPHHDGVRLENAALNDVPAVDEKILDAELEKKWERIAALRDTVNRSLEAARAAKEIGKSLEASVEISANGEVYDFITEIPGLDKLFIVSAVSVAKDESLGATLEDIAVKISKAEGVKCPRCWTFSKEAGTDAEHPELCPRCTAVVKNA